MRNVATSENALVRSGVRQTSHAHGWWIPILLEGSTIQVSCTGSNIYIALSVRACFSSGSMLTHRDHDFGSRIFVHDQHYCIIYINYQRTLEETGKRGQETYCLKSCLQLNCCLAFHRLLECTGIKVCLITSILGKPSSSRTLLVQTPQLTFVSRNRIPDISLHSSSPYDKGPHPR